jgi:hypothetical protein
MLFIDSHVHIYDCFDLETFFDSAYANFKRAAEQLGHGHDFTGILLLTETSKNNWFHRLSEYADDRNLPEGKYTGDWRLNHTDEYFSLSANSGDFKKVILVAGRQIVTEEKIEVLALCTSASFNDRKPISTTIKEIAEKDGVPVIPWGIGKWIGNRGKIVKQIIKNKNTSLIYLGDNGNRPNFWAQPRIFKQAKKNGIHILPGSDPLPFTSESCRAGSNGFYLQVQMDSRKPATLIKQLLMDKANYPVRVFGQLEKNHRFLLNQMRTQIRKRFARTAMN